MFYLAANRKLTHPGCYHNFEGNLPAHVKIAVQSLCNKASIIFSRIARPLSMKFVALNQSLTVLCDKLIN